MFNQTRMKGILIDTSTNSRCKLDAVTILGRNSECQLSINDQRVSRRHAMIRHQDDGFWFYDLGSFNGSLHNGSRVTTTLRLRNGDTLEFADHVYRFEQVGDPLNPRNHTALGDATIALIRSKSVIMLVSDIKNFTTLSELLPADELARTIGGWYSDCDRLLAKHGATVDKFIGDSVLAYWPSTTPGHHLSALRAARDLRDVCKKTYLARQKIFDGINHDFTAGVAVHQGEVAYGGMAQKEFTLVGDPVNLTFRLETLTRILDEPVLASFDFFEDWPEGDHYCKPLGSHKVKGRAQAVDVCAIKSFPED